MSKKKKKRNRKRKTTKKIVDNNIKTLNKEVTLMDTDDEVNTLENVDIQTKDESIDIEIEDNSIEIHDDKKKKHFIEWIILLVIIIIVGFVIMFFPRINLVDKEKITISYKDKYVEPGYNGYIFNKEVTDKIKVNGVVKDGVVGEYKIEYSFKLLGIKIRKIRNVFVVDRDKPNINVDSEVLEVCPNQEIPDINYSAIDEYDGDITSKIEKIVNDDKIILKVGDTSNNVSTLVVKVERKDSVKPEIKLKGKEIIYLKFGERYVEPGYTAYDNCMGDITSKVEVSGDVERDIGAYTIKYVVRDDAGNKTEVIRNIIVRGNIKNDGVINDGSIYLTFDDGPNKYTTEKILDVLKEEGVKATFFVTCSGSDDLIKRIHDEGHTIAIHTASHDYSYIYSSLDNYYKDMGKVSDRIKKITGVDTKIFRFPGGSSNTVSKKHKIGIMTELTKKLVDEGYRYYDWNVDSMDASTARSSDDVFYNVTSNLNYNRANMVLMHDTKDITANAIRDIIKYGKSHDYEFKQIDMSTYMIRHGLNN